MEQFNWVLNSWKFLQWPGNETTPTQEPGNKACTSHEQFSIATQIRVYQDKNVSTRCTCFLTFSFGEMTSLTRCLETRWNDFS